MDHERAHWGRMDHERADWGGMDHEPAHWGGMDKERAPQATDTPYLKLPWLLVAGGLVVLLGAALAVGLLANRSLHEQITLPTPTPAPVLAPPPTAVAPLPTVPAPQAATVPALASTAVAPTATSPPATATPPPQSTSTPVATGTAQPALASTPRPTVDPALADEVSSAYEHYWDVRAEALYNLDDSQLSDVMAGEHLATVEGILQQLRSEGRAIKTSIEHHFDVLEATATDAQIKDTYLSNSVYIDSKTHAQLSDPPGDQVTEMYQLELLDGGWKVVTIVSVQ